MSGFFSRPSELLSRELTKEPSRGRRFMAPPYVLMALAGFFLVLFAEAPFLAPPTLGFLAIAAGLLLSGAAELGAGGSSGARAMLRLAGFGLGVLGLLAVVLSSAMQGG